MSESQRINRRRALVGLTAFFVAGLAAAVVLLAIPTLETEATGPPPTYTLTVVVVGDGCSVSPNQGTYSAGSVVQLDTTAKTGWRFDHWEGHLTGTANPGSVTMNSNKVIMAFFVDSSYYTLTTQVSPAGIANVSPSWGSYAPGTQVQLSATAVPGYIFDHWSGTPTLTGTTQPVTVTMNSHRSVTAHFRTGYTLTTYNGNQGTVSPQAGTYDPGTVLSLLATPDAGYRFAMWSGGATGTSNPVSLTMDANKVVSAYFHKTWTLATTISPAGAGSVNPAAGTFDDGQNVYLTATANPDWHFKDWLGGLTGTANPGQLLMNANKGVTAEFELNNNSTAIFFPYDTVDVVESDSWQTIQVLLEERGGTRYENVTVRFTGQYNGYGFGGRLFDVLFTDVNGHVAMNWSPSQTGTRSVWISTFQDSVYQDPVVCHMWLIYLQQQRGVYLGTPYSIPVRFIDDDPVPINITVTPETKGTVAITPLESHYQDDEVTLTAEPDPGYQFVEWQGDLTGNTNPVQLTLDTAKDITAVFERDGTFFLNVTVEGNGTVTRSPDQGSYAEGTVVTLTAEAGTSTLFDTFSGDIDRPDDPLYLNYPEANPIFIVMDRDRDITAAFAEMPGLDSVDMFNDLTYFLLEIESPISANQFDRNEIEHTQDLEIVFVSNGIPDVAELEVLEKVLNTPELGFSGVSGITHDSCWDSWITNWTQAQVDLAGVDPRIQRVVAGYMTLATDESVRFISDALYSNFDGATLSYSSYDFDQMPYFYSFEDADGDGVTNVNEWNAAISDFPESPIPEYVRMALDGVAPQSGSSSGGGGTSSFCNAPQCLPEGVVTLLGSTGLTDVYGGAQFDEIADLGFTATVAPVGTDVKVGTELNAASTQVSSYRFLSWDAPGSMLDGSYEKNASGYLMFLPQTVRATYLRCKLVSTVVTQPPAITLVTVNASGSGGFFEAEEIIDGRLRHVYNGPPGTSAMLVAYPTPGYGLAVEKWEVDSAPDGWNPRYNFNRWANVTMGSSYVAPHVANEYYVESLDITGPLWVGPSRGGQGGTAYICQSTGWPGGFSPPIRAVEGSAITISASPDLGYAFKEWSGHPDWPAVKNGSIEDLSGARAKFQRNLFKLYIEVGGDDPGCAGYVRTADPSDARAGYTRNSQVTLVAEPSACCYDFDHWELSAGPSGGGVNFYSDILNVTIFGDMSARAIFKEKFPQVQSETTVGLDLFHQQPLYWNTNGYDGDRFFCRLWDSQTPTGWDWDDVVVREGICYLHDDFPGGLTPAEKARISRPTTAEFRVNYGQRQIPVDDTTTIEEVGYWIEGTEGQQDSHSIEIASYPTIVNYFAGSSGTRTIVYKQYYYVENAALGYPHEVIGQAVITMKLSGITLTPCYTSAARICHQQYEKGGAHHWCAWENLPSGYNKQNRLSCTLNCP